MIFGLIAFFGGLFLLIKGSFRIAGRQVLAPQARLIGGVLMLPLVLTFCAGTLMIQAIITPQMLAEGIDMDAFVRRPEVVDVVIRMELIEIFTVVGAVGFALFMIFNIPRGEVTAKPGNTAAPANFSPPSEQAPPAPTRRDHPLSDGERPEPPRPRVNPPAPRPAVPVPAAKAAPSAPPDLMTVEQAAAYIGLTPAEVVKLIEESKLGAVKSRGSYIVAKIALDDYLGQA
jgi:excisionase family DNA binding protein